MISLNIIINYWDNISESQIKNSYKLFSTNHFTYIKYIKTKTNEESNIDDLIFSECFNFSDKSTVNHFINKIFKQLKNYDFFEINNVVFELYKNSNIIMKDILDWEFTGFFRFKGLLDEYLKFLNSMNIEQNTKMVNSFLVSQTDNIMTQTLPNEIIEIILRNL